MLFKPSYFSLTPAKMNFIVRSKGRNISNHFSKHAREYKVNCERMIRGEAK